MSLTWISIRLTRPIKPLQSWQVPNTYLGVPGVHLC